MVYYGRRFYSPSQGRFLGRDPIEEKGGLNLYGFCLNNPVNAFDLLGEGPYVTSINGTQYQIDIVPRNAFNPSLAAPGSWTATPDKTWGISAFLVWNLNGGLNLGFGPSEYVYVRTPVKSTGPTVTPTPTKPTTPAPAPNPNPTVQPKSNLLPGYATGITANLVATLLVNEVAFPSSKEDTGFTSWDDTKRAMDAIASELYNRIHSIPNGYTQYQIAHITTSDINSLILNSGQYQNFKGSISQKVIDHVNYLVGIANQGSPGAYADAINYAITLSELLYQGGVPTDPFASQGGTLYHMATGNSPGGATVPLGTLGGNDFFTVPANPASPPPKTSFMGPTYPGYVAPDLPIAVFAGGG